MVTAPSAPSRQRPPQRVGAQRLSAWVKGGNPGRAADRQPNPQQETLCDGLPHFGSLSPGRVDNRSAHDWKRWATTGRIADHMQLQDFVS